MMGSSWHCTYKPSPIVHGSTHNVAHTSQLCHVQMANVSSIFAGMLRAGLPALAQHLITLMEQPEEDPMVRNASLRGISSTWALSDLKLHMKCPASHPPHQSPAWFELCLRPRSPTPCCLVQVAGAAFAVLDALVEWMSGQMVAKRGAEAAAAAARADVVAVLRSFAEELGPQKQRALVDPPCVKDGPMDFENTDREAGPVMRALLWLAKSPKSAHRYAAS